MKNALLIVALLAASFTFNLNAQTSIVFDDGYVDLGTGISLTSYTKEVWINWADIASANNVLSGSSANPHAFYGPGKRMRAGHDANFSVVIDFDPMIKDVWEHWAVSYDGTTGAMALYRNGVLKSSGTAAPGFVATVFNIGAYALNGTPALFFEGNIDDVRIWNDVRTPTEIAANFNQCLTGNEAGLVAFYDFEDGSGTILTDGTTNGNDGTLINTNPPTELLWVSTPDVCDTDTTAPTTTITSTASPSTSISPIPVTITFSEDVTDFDITDLTVGNGTASNFDGSAASYTVDIIPTSDGTITVDVAADVAMDPFYKNGNLAATQFSIAYNAAPSVVITSSEVSLTNTSPIPVTITFSEDVTGFDVTDLNVANGTAGNFAGTGAIYTADITPTLTDGTVTVDVAADIAIDGSANGNTAAVQFSIDYDGEAPTVVITSTASPATNMSPIPVTITFSEDVTGFDITDLSVSNGTAGNFAGTGSVYTADVTPTLNGAVTIDVAADAAIDVATNGNTVAVQFSIGFDGTDPSVMITSTEMSPTNALPIPVTITFNEDVTGFDVTDLTVGNGTADNFAGTGAVYTVDVTPSLTDGTITVDVAADVAFDAFTNGNTAATQFSINYDAINPTVVIASTATSPTNTSPIPVTITFSEDVTGFDVSDLVVVNGTAGNFAGSGTSYTADITPTTLDGTVTVDIAADAGEDAATNGNIAAAQFSLDYDGTDPTVVIASTATSPTNVSPIPVTITFSEDVTGFDITDLVVVNGTAGNFAGSGASYSADITPTTLDGTLTVDVAADAAIDESTNGNTAATQFSVDYDVTDPTVVIASTAVSPTNTSPIPVTITFSEDVTGFDIADLVVVNGTAGNFAGSGTSYTVDITPTVTDGMVTVDVAADAGIDEATNGNTAATQFSINYDAINPTVVIASTATSPTNTSPIPVTITFSEAVTGFDITDLVVMNGTAGNFAGTGAIYTADITPTTLDGIVTVDIAADAGVDAATNGNTAAPQFSVDYDGTDPTVVIASTAISPTNASPIPVTITFSEDVTGFDITDLVVVNGTAGNFAGSGTSYTADITPTVTDGTVTVDVAADAGVDESTNGNTAATQFSIDYDGTDPTVVIASTATSPTNVSPIPVTITFSESVTGFDITDLVVVNGTAGNFAGSGTNYTADITPTTLDGTVTVDIAADAGIDESTNGNSAAAQFSIDYDVTDPTVVIASTTTSPTNSSLIPVTFTFSEAVTGFNIGDLIVGNGAISGFTGSGANYSVNITPLGNGMVTVDVAADSGIDEATNGNIAAIQFSIEYDSIEPSATVTIDDTSLIIGETATVTITFDNQVTGFDNSDLVIENGTLTAVNSANGGITFTATFTPTPGIDVVANVITLNNTGVMDLAGNSGVGTTDSGNYSIDTIAPTLVISSDDSDLLAGETATITFTFSEAATGFTDGDITVSGGTLVPISTADGGLTYTATLTPDAEYDGNIDITVLDNTYTDADANNGTGDSLTIEASTDTPTLVISSDDTDLLAGETATITFTFSEAATGFTDGDITISGGTLVPISTADGGLTYTATLTPDAEYDGNIDITVLDNAYTDADANNGTGDTLTIEASTDTPTLVISSDDTDLLAGETATITFTFSEAATGFTDGDITVSGGTLGPISTADGGVTYTATLTPDAEYDGNIDITVLDNAYTDADANNGTGDSLTIEASTDTPTLVISSDDTDLLAGETATITFTFSEAATGFTDGDITVSGGTLGPISTADGGLTYTATLTPDAEYDGNIDITVLDNTYTDADANNGTGDSLTIEASTDTPTLVISSDDTDLLAGETATITFTFSEVATGFTDGDITVSGGTLGPISTADVGLTYTATLTPDAEYDGNIDITVLDNAYTDADANNGTGDSLTIVSSTIVPTVAITSTEVSPTSANPIPVTITFSEDVTGFDITDLTIGNGTAGNFAGSGTTYTADITPTIMEGIVTVDVDANAGMDSATNGNTVATQFNINYDGVAPTVSITSTEVSPTNNSPISLTITFSEDVTGFDVNDLTVVNGTASDFIGLDASYLVVITPDADGLVTVDIAADSAVDTSLNGNIAATQFSIDYDGTRPSVVLSSTEPSPTNSASFFVTIGFSENVTGFTIDDIVVANGTTSGFIGSDDTYIVAVFPTTSGTVTVDVAENVASDAVMNGNTAATQFSIEYDGIDPTAMITSTATSPTSNNPIPVTITFSEDVTGFDITDLVVVNGITGNFAGSGTSYTADISPTADGEVTVDIAADVAVDAASNGNTAATQFSIDYETFIKIDAKVFLQGPYSGGSLSDDLRVGMLIPTTSPYTDALTTNASVFTATGADAIVDWIWLEVRDTDGTTVVSQRSALLQSDGDVVDVDGVSPVVVDVPDGDYHLMVSHRHHLGVLTASTVSLAKGGTTAVDLTSSSALITGGLNGIADMGDGNYAMYSGDFNGDGQIQNSDKNAVQALIGTSGVSDADLDMNGQVQNTDIQLKLNPNIGKGQQFSSRALDLKLHAKRRNNN